MKKTWIRIVSAGIIGILCFALFPSMSLYAFQSEVEASESQAVSVLIGESVTLKQYAENTQTETYTILSGAKYVRDNGNGTFTFLAKGTVKIQGKVYSLKGTVLSTHLWIFSVTNAAPQIVTQPQSITVYSGEKAFFTVDTRQEEEFLSYRWICCDSNGKNVSTYVFPNATGWTSKTLIINDCKSWMNGYKFYCIVSLKSNTRTQTLAPKNASSYPVLSVKNHPVESVLSLIDLSIPQIGVPADYEVTTNTDSCKVKSIAYYINGKICKNYVPSAGDVVEIRVVLEPSEEYSFSAEEYILLWEGFQNDSVSGKSSQKTFSFVYRVTEDGDDAEFEDSNQEKTGDEKKQEEEFKFNHFENRLFRIVFGSVIIALVLAFFVIILIKQLKNARNSQ